MSFQFNKQAITLDEKLKRAVNITYNIKGSDDAIFMRNFLYYLIEKALTKLPEERTKEVQDTLDDLSRQL